jgi:hypothetical protein
MADAVITVTSPTLTFEVRDWDGILIMPVLKVERDHRSLLPSPGAEGGGHERLGVERT